MVNIKKSLLNLKGKIIQSKQKLFIIILILGELTGGAWIKHTKLKNQLTEANLNSLYTLMDVGGDVLIIGSKTVEASVSINFDYREEMRFQELVTNGYQSFFNSLDPDQANDIREELKTMVSDNDENASEAKLILNGLDKDENGEVDITSVAWPEVEETLCDAINAAGDNDQKLRNEASKWFKDANHEKIFNAKK